MKQSTFITIALGVAIVVAAAAVAGCAGGGSTTPTATPAPMKTTTDILEKFDALKEKVNASGLAFGGAAIQLIKGDETAMVYLYRPANSTDISGMLSGGYSALYSVYDDEDPLMVGLIDTTQKISAQQYKVDVYAMERPMVALYLDGDITKAELVNKALYVTPQTQSLRTSNNTTVTPAPLPRPTNNFTPPSDRQAYIVEALNKTAYKPANLQTGSMQDGTKAISLALSIPSGLTNAQKYDAIETALKVCAGAFGDFDRYYISLVTDSGSEYYVVDAGSTPVLDYMEGSINQNQLYRNINLTYYTK